MTAAIIYPLLCVTAWYLGSQAKVTHGLWGRYPPGFDSFMQCSACTGFWYGLGCGALGWWQNWAFLSLDGRHWLTPVIVALCAIVWTPLIARWHTVALYVLSGGNDGES
ncbi:MAG: hypothetical protein JSV86_10550 [Gemmatimonadota bacterium]|nr:MAG: hypothetical protein JSV86_10550 [Gemmatimonadota bacterium]